MSRINDIFKPNHKALIAYVTVGYPSIEDTLKVIPLLATSGCDIVELGIPFSDPLADGVTIQKASFHALQNGVTPKLCVQVARQLRQKIKIPMVFMTYYNPVFNNGMEEFCNACTHSLVRTITEKAGEVIHTSVTVVPNFTVKDAKNKDGDAVVVFARGL